MTSEPQGKVLAQLTFVLTLAILLSTDPWSMMLLIGHHYLKVSVSLVSLIFLFSWLLLTLYILFFPSIHKSSKKSNYLSLASCNDNIVFLWLTFDFFILQHSPCLVFCFVVFKILFLPLTISFICSFCHYPDPGSHLLVMDLLKYSIIQLVCLCCNLNLTARLIQQILLALSYLCSTKHVMIPHYSKNKFLNLAFKPPLTPNLASLNPSRLFPLCNNYHPQHKFPTLNESVTSYFINNQDESQL